MLTSGNATAPLTKPAFKRTLNLGAIAFPFKLLLKITTVAFSCVAASAITLVNTCASKAVAAATVCTFVMPKIIDAVRKLKGA